ncbi:hypothetical protein EMPS_00982 [Entomortierella parvispora]|uniref:Uncharacterized protein n=1 Tax=Entomortierella parvispora TaxID=205924 RepID=A0A9P3LS39_9FUNG|nr:hypothetical protein EMPS_00982 [Entomortierella parvispora]
MASPSPSPAPAQASPATCPPSSHTCAPACASGYMCMQTVISGLGQCPVSSCIKQDADPAAGNGTDPTTSSSKSIVGPIVGGIVGLVVIGALVIFIIRRRRRQRLRMFHSSSVMLDQDDYLESFSKRWHGSTGSELEGHKDVIRIAYIPSMISEHSLNIAESSPRQEASKSPFSNLQDEDRKKHDSAILDEAVVMGVTTKATAQVMKLNNLKQTKSDLIQRSNTLHSSNSIKRSKSQRRLEAASAGGKTRQRVRSPLGESNSASDSEQDNGSASDRETTARHVATTRRQSKTDKEHDNPFMTEEELISFEPSSTPKSTTSNRSSNPFLSASEYSTSSTMVGGATEPVFTSMAISLAGDDLISSPISDMMSANLRPWTSGSSTGMRDSTFSTASDSRSSTRGDGEEIMIFWDGHRDSKASNL